MAGMEILGGQSNQVQRKKENNLCSDINDDISGAKQYIFHYAKLYKLYCSFSPTPVAAFILCY